MRVVDPHLYAFIRDIAVPGLLGIGTIAVAIAALAVSRQTAVLQAQAENDRKAAADRAARKDFADRVILSFLADHDPMEYTKGRELDAIAASAEIRADAEQLVGGAQLLWIFDELDTQLKEMESAAKASVRTDENPTIEELRAIWQSGNSVAKISTIAARWASDPMTVWFSPTVRSVMGDKVAERFDEKFAVQH